MKKIIKTIIVFLFACSIFSVAEIGAQTNSKGLTDAEKAYILSKWCTEVKYNFVFYNDLAYNWDSLCTTALPQLLETKSYDEYVNGLKLLCTKLSDGHTSIYTVKTDENPEWIMPLPFKTKRIEDKVFVTKVLMSDFQKQGLEEGCEVLKIDDMDVIDFVNKFRRPYTSTSTPQWLDYSPYSEFELTKDKGSKVSKILFKNKKGKTFSITGNRLIKWDLNDNPSALDYKVLENNIGLLKIGSFMGNSFIETFDKLYQEIEKTDALIIDLRNNHGGHSEYANYIISHLSDSPVKMGKWSSRMYIAAHGSWNYPQEWYTQIPDDLKPIEGKSRYTKPVAVLVNATTFSSAENFCVAFRSINKGKIIGTTTGGSTGNPINIDLGHGIFAEICTKNELDANGNKFIGIGIIPDIQAEETVDSYLKGKDLVVEAALRELKK